MKNNLLFSQTTALGKKLGKRLVMVLTMLLMLGIGQVWGAEVFNITSYTSFPNGWTNNNVNTGSYFNFNTNKCSLTTSTYDPHTDLILTYKVATYGSGTNHPLTMQLLDENGNVKQTHTTGTPTSSTYISGTWSIGTVNYKFKIKFYLAEAGKGVRLQVPKLVGNPATSTEPYTVKFYKTSTTFESVTEKSVGDGVTPPSMEQKCGDWTFQGWSESSSNIETSTTKLELVTLTGEKYYPTEDLDLYPVYTKSEGGGGIVSWNKITTAPADWSGEYLIVNSDYAMTSDFKSGTSGEFVGANVTISNNQVTTSPSDKMIWIVEKNGSTAQYSFKNKSTGTYANITGTSSTNAALSASAIWFTISSSSTSGVWKINSVAYSARCFAYYSNNKTFRTYANSSNTTGSLYRKEGSGSTTYYYSYPQCTIETSVTLDLNGGTFDSKPDGWEEDGNNNYKKEGVTSAIDLPTPKRTGYNFGGWYDGETKVNSLYTPSETVTLVAKWTAITYTITYENLGEVTNNANNPTTYTIESETITFEEPNERAGYIFKGWEPATIEKGSTGPVTVTAKWCELLGDATELSVQTDYEEGGQTYVKFSWTPADNTKSHATKQVICIGKVGEEKKCTDLEGNQVWSGDLRSKLTPGEYEWTIQAIGDGETYCDGEVISGPNFTIEELITDNCRWVEIALEDITPEDEIVVTMGDDKTVYALGTEKITRSPKSQAITITSGMIDINQGFDYSKYTWSISAVTDGYTLQPYGTDKYLYGLKSYISIGNNSTNNVFTIFTSAENGNKCFMYTIEYTPYYLGHGTEDGQTAWKQFESSDNLLKSNTLKLYKKTCLPANEYWVNYNLSNVTCEERPNSISHEDLILEFSANDGYELPENISVSIGNDILPEDNDVYIWESETGELLISAAQVTDNITITIEGCEQLAAPENLLATNITSISAVLSWDAVAKADEYIVFVTDGETNLEIPTTNCTITIEGLSKNTYYLWDVTATADNYCDSKKPSVLTNEFTTLDVYTVTFIPNGGTAVEPQPVEHGGKATKPANPTKTGYTFAGWYTEADTEFNFNTPIESATTLYAKWNANQYTITFRQQWGNGGTETATVHFDNNDFSVSPITVPTRNGYTFGGYYTAESGAGTQLIDVSGAWLNAPTYIEGGKWVYADNLTLYAKWTQNFTITWKANGQLYHTQTAMMGTAIAKPDDPDEFACDDKVFVGWLDKTISGSTNEEPTFVTDFGTIQAAKTYYAVFATLTGTPSNDYNKITNINDLTDGEYVIAYSYDGGTQVVLKNTTKDAKYMNASALAPSSNKYTSPSEEYIWQLQKQDDGSYYMYNSSVNKFLYATTSALQLSDNPAKYNISYDNTYSHWKIKLSDNASYYMHGYVSGSSYDFRVSTSGSGNKYRVYLYKNASTAVYSDYVTTCVEIPTPHWEGAEIDNADIAVDCGTISYKTNASTITFPTDKNYDLTYPITLTASEGFLLSTNKQNDVYEKSVTVTPVQSDDNKGKITQSVHVRADATGKKTNFDGTITISGDQLAEDQIIEVHAVVDCPQYTLTFNDCGDTKTITDFAGTSVEEMEPWAETCSEPFQYVFDGWATAPVTNGTEEYEKVDFSTFTMPNNNTTILYAVYRYAEEGGEPVNGYVKVTEALADWSGDYVIVDDENLFAIKNAYRENTNSNKTLAGETVTIENDKVVSPSANIVWSFSKNGNGYTMYNVATDIYAGIGTHSRAAVLSEIIADENNIKIIFDDATDIAKVSGIKNNRCFQYYVTNDGIKEWRTYDSNQSQYNTGYLYRLSEKTIRYTSALVCGSIEAEDAIVTSTVGQIVKVNVPITLNYSEAASITGTSDNEAFTVVTKNDVAVGESNIEVHYKPTAYVNTTNQEETATITLTTSNGATTTFNITGRCLPEIFAIVAKVGNIWYALPSQGLNSTTPPVAYPVEVDNMADPTAVVSVPANADWSLRQVYASSGSNDRFAAHGENLVFVNDANPQKALNAGSTGNYLLTDAQYDGYHNTTNPGLYEWTPTTTDLETYTLTNAQRTDRTLNVATNTVFGVHSDNKASTEVRFLPITGRYTPAALQVVEWKEISVVIMYNGDPAQEVSVSSNFSHITSPTDETLSSFQKDIAIYELPTTNNIDNATKALCITIGTEEKTILSIPYIISGSKNDIDILPGSSVTARQEVAKVSDLVILKGATLTAAGSKSDPYKFRNVTVYGGGKLVVPADNGFGVNSLTLRAGGITDAGEYDYVYPQFELRGTFTNSAAKINLDYLTTKEQYYTFVAPFAVNTQDIKYPVDIYGNNVAAENTGSFEFQYYDGAARAEGKPGWKVVEEGTDGATLNPGQGYTFLGMPKKVSVNGGSSTRQKFGIHRIPMTVTAANAMSHETTDQTAPLSVHLCDKNNNSGWNLIGNPYMTTIGGLTNDDIQVGKLVHTTDANGNWTGGWHWDTSTEATNQRFLVFPSNDGQSYEAVQASNATLYAFKNFFVQISNEGANALSIPRTTPASPLQAPAHHAEEVAKDVELAIVLEQDEEHTDQMDLLINNIYTANFERDADFTKMMNATNLNLYGVHPYDNLSFVAMDHYTAEQSVKIGYQVPQAGEYTLRMSEKLYVMFDKIEALYVTDHEMSPEVTTDIISEPYRFTVKNAETNNERFTISLKLKSENQGPTTGWENIDVGKDQSIKFIHQDRLYILRNGVIYDATGQEIQTINK